MPSHRPKAAPPADLLSAFQKQTAERNYVKHTPAIAVERVVRDLIAAEPSDEGDALAALEGREYKDVKPGVEKLIARDFAATLEALRAE